MAAVSVIIMTFNEEKHIARCLDSIAGLSEDVHVVDSFSTDRTVEIAESYGCKVHSQPFENHPAIWQWAIDNIDTANDWVLALDVDFILTPELSAEIEQVVADPSRAEVGYYLRRRQIFRGRFLRHGTMYPRYWLKLFKRDRVSIDLNNLVDVHFYVDGASGKLRSDFIEDNENDRDLAYWINKQIRYAKRQAREEVIERARGMERPDDLRFFGSVNQRRLWLKRMLLSFPLYTRPFVYFIYRYFLRLGFLDGRQGFLFHFTQAFLYRLLVDVGIDELRRNGGAAALLAEEAERDGTRQTSRS